MSYFTKGEKILWILSITFILISYILFPTQNYLTLIASIVGGTSLIFNAKGNPFGQLLMLIFSVLYGIISYSYDYYGEMITYLGMTAPMAFFSLISWLNHPFQGRCAEVTVNHICQQEMKFMILLTILVTILFYGILKFFHTANLILSTISVSTSFVAVYLTFRRSPYYALGYAANDIVLIILWILATMEEISYLSVVICFITFFVNDIYAFFNWKKIYIKQNMNTYQDWKE